MEAAKRVVKRMKKLLHTVLQLNKAQFKRDRAAVNFLFRLKRTLLETNICHRPQRKKGKTLARDKPSSSSASSTVPLPPAGVCDLATVLRADDPEYHRCVTAVRDNFSLVHRSATAQSVSRKQKSLSTKKLKAEQEQIRVLCVCKLTNILLLKTFQKHVRLEQATEMNTVRGLFCELHTGAEEQQLFQALKKLASKGFGNQGTTDGFESSTHLAFPKVFSRRIIQQSKGSTENSNDLRVVVLSRVRLGRVKVSSFDANRVGDESTNTDSQEHDSLYDVSKEAYLVSSAAQVYPEFLIVYYYQDPAEDKAKAKQLKQYQTCIKQLNVYRDQLYASFVSRDSE